MNDEIETPPLLNSNAMKCMACLLVGGTTQSVDLSTLFGQSGTSHDYILEADGGKVYVAMSTLASTINERATGNGNTVCWPIPDGTALPFKPVSGREQATGIATMCSYNVLNYKVATTVGSAYLRIYRASLSRGQGTEEFKAP
jgi:hypothetical protein